ncbi:MAG: hypothetical protein EBR82_24170 [Caulobacteraceae bacterium]|nr:hypothetical protein [Caulobacteraceae bacterium]
MIIEAILKLNPKAEVSVSGDDINTIVWENGTPPIPKEQILAIIPQVELDIALDNLRAKRNKLLADSDYIVLADSTITPAKKSEWMNYRTALRNLTQGLDTIEKVNNVAYPLKPSK